ncbi:MAG: DUF1559 domain-containing protein [Planctomycetes bacterium]|nr:DUF1559 domain-containing protein [Planctomycetota bacterium]
MLRSWTGLVLIFLSIGSVPARAAEVQPLDYVPSNAAVFAHLRVGDLLDSPLYQNLRKTSAKEIDGLFDEAYPTLGLRLDSVETATFFYPTMPMGPGDETTFVIIVSTRKPYDKVTLFKEIRDKRKEQVKDGHFPLANKLYLKFLDEKSFVVLHEIHFEMFKKPPAPQDKDGVVTEALKMARDKHHFAASIDFSKLPNELFTAAPPELQPFLPLLKAKTTAFFADLKEKDLQVGINLVTTDANAALDAERSFKLLMKLASDNLGDAFKEEKPSENFRIALPLLKELERGINQVKTTRDGARLDNLMTLKTDQPLGEVISKLVNRVRAAENETQSLSWRVALLPQLGEENLYKQFRLDEPWDSEHNFALAKKMPKVFASSAKKSEIDTHFRLFHSNGAVFDLIQPRQLTEIKDGASNTIMVVESAESSPWTKPDDFEFEEKLAIEKLIRFTDGKTSALFADGSVRTVKKGLGDKTWRLLIQRDDGEVLPDLDK